MKVHGFDLGEGFSFVPREAPESEPLVGEDDLVEEEVDVGDGPTETGGDR